ncbi:amino acid ABC transporter substrate-binding protein [Roseateles aquatilis]|uniref:Amino acid ABC transporter substrate-binding protein n=1 Tax=Roseateles aquatilis TaxID=431061 RepID=A0A246IT47_9BURK|nr:amino acid ABC transporter substrate-binding protein [Roseateles aquatilis]OWQ83401.1 amino acid ABC transporter substrate-binding protein [Roseateles aquatilis]
MTSFSTRRLGGAFALAAASLASVPTLCLAANPANPAVPATPAALAAGPAIDTLARIRETRAITLGVREAARPFSFVNEQKQGMGYSVDLCLAAVEEIKRELKLPELKVHYAVVTGADRIPKLQKGEIDLECGSTTNTRARQEQVDFSYTIFVAGMRVLLPAGTKVESIKDLDGMTIALTKGTTSEKLFTQLQNSGEARMQLVQYPGNNEAFKALREGKARAFAQDDALLLGLASRDKALDSVSLGAMAFSVEPYGIMMRKGDAKLGAAVDRALGRLFAGAEIQQLYGKWFQTEALTIPMNRLTRDGFKRPNKEAGVAMLLGYSI